MTENQIEKFICLIKQKDYETQSMQYSTNAFKKVLMIKSKYLLVPKILISFTDVPCLNGEDLLAEVEKLNKQFNNNKPLIVLLILSMNTVLKDNLWFYGKVFAHLAVHDEMNNCLYYEKNFHYVGAKGVRNLIYLLKHILY